MKIYLNNKFIDVKKAQVAALDRGLLYGQGVFETMRAKKGVCPALRDCFPVIYKSVCPYLNEHFERLKKGAAFVGIRFGLTRGGIKKIIKKLTEINSFEDAYVRVTLTGGDNGPRGALAESMFPKAQTLLVYSHRYNPPPASFYKKGVRLTLSKVRRSRSSKIARHKTICYAENMLAKREALSKNCFDALFLDEKGFVAECATSNIFWVKRGVLYTPSLECPILPGITRKAVIVLAKKAGVKVRELNFPRHSDFLKADEAFVTNSLVGVLPVKKIGKITSQLRGLYEKELCHCEL